MFVIGFIIRDIDIYRYMCFNYVISVCERLIFLSSRISEEPFVKAESWEFWRIGNMAVKKNQ